MYNGKTKFTGARRRIVVNRRTGIAGILAGDDDLTEVVVSAKAIPDVYGRVINNAPKTAPWSAPFVAQSETNPTSYGREVPNSPYKPTEYADMQVIEVAGTRIPWWMWATGGLLGAAVLFKFSQR